MPKIREPRPFWTETPFKKITVLLTAPGGFEHRIEFFADGQQCVVDDMSNSWSRDSVTAHRTGGVEA
jgi:hypothetical protein